MTSYERILYATDFSESARHAISHAATFAAAFEGKIDVVHVLALGQDDAAMAAEQMPEAVPEEHAHLVEDRRIVRAIKPELGILEEAREGHYDLIVMGTHGRSGLSHVFLGSVAERVVQLATCAVLTVRQPSHAFEHP